MPLPQLALNLFGVFEAQYEGKPIAGFATDKIRALLAYLAIESGRPHRRETLAALLWPDYPDEDARGNLRKSLYRLRKTLQEADAALPDRLLTQSRQTITLNPELLDLDISRFSHLIREAKSAADPVAFYAQAAELYQGEVLKGISIPDAYAFEEWLTIQREVYHQNAVEALTRLISRHETHNDPDGVLVAAQRLLALDPWHEQTYRQIMRAHRQKGNRSGAIAQYHELREILLRDLGVEPSHATTSLYEQMVSESAPAGKVYPLPQQSQPRNFPVPLTSFIGRKSELDQLTSTLQDPACRLLSLTGPGGIGKTRLCIEGARRLAAGPHRFGDGLIFVPLAQVQEDGLFISAIGQSINLPLRASQEPRRELLNYLKNKQMLLVLDNFEQLLAQRDGGQQANTLSFVVELLTASHGVTLLVTSREPLSLQGEWVIALEGLGYAAHGDAINAGSLEQPAPQLFIQSARRYRASFDPAEFVGAIREICRLTNGLPLALEIAAAWMRAYDPEEIALRIAESLDFLTSPHRDVPLRQRSMRAVFASAWDQLAPAQQEVLAAVSVFRGRFAAQAVLAVTRATVLDLAVLVEKSLLRRAEERSYELHDLVRQFASEKLSESEHDQAVQARHAEYYFSFLDEQMPGLNGPNPQDAIALIRRAMDNIRTAWQWAVSHRQLVLLDRAMYGIAQFLILTGSNREGEALFEKALYFFKEYSEEGTESLAVQSQLLAHLAWFQSGLGKNHIALDNAAEAVALADRCEDSLCRAYGLSILGWTLQTQGRYDASESALTEAIELFNQNDEPLRASLALIRLGSLYWRRRDFEKTLAYYRQSLEIEQRLNNKRGINRAYGGIGLVYSHLEKYDEALEWINKALALDRELGNRFGIARHLGNMGTLYLTLGDYPRALACYEEAARVDREIEHQATLLIWIAAMGNVYRQMGDFDRALDYYDQAIGMGEELGDRFNLCESLLGKGEIFLVRGDIAQAEVLIEQGRHLADEVQRKEIQFRARLLEARILASSEHKEEARRQLKTMLSNLEESDRREEAAQINYELWQVDREPEYARQALVEYEAELARVPKAESRKRAGELRDFLAEQEQLR